MSWPAFTKVRCYLGETLVAESSRSRLDLADSLMLWRDDFKAHTFRITVTVGAKDWKSWTTDKVQEIEGIIREDLEFDSYRIERLDRLNSPGKTHCTKPFSWTLTAISEFADAETIQQTRTSNGTRFKVARNDATLKTIKANIEKVFGLPAGSIAIVAPGNRKTEPHSTVKELKDTWDRYQQRG